MNYRQSETYGQGSRWIDTYQISEVLAEQAAEKEEFMLDASTSYSSSEILQNHSLDVEKTTKRTQLVALLVLLVGAIASASFLYIGLTGEEENIEIVFERRATDMFNEVEGSVSDYEVTALWVHEACHDWRETNFTATDFEVLYHYLVSGGLDFYEMQWVPNVTHEERPMMEEMGKEVFGNVTNYTGFVGQEPDPKNPGELYFTSRSAQPFYYPITFGEPREKIGSVAGYDLYSPPWERVAILEAIKTGKPAVTGPFKLVQHQDEDGYSTVLYHPGTPLPEKFYTNERHDMAALLIHFQSLLKRAARRQTEILLVYLYDTTPSPDKSEPQFLSGIKTGVKTDGASSNFVMLPETPYEPLDDSELYFEKDMDIGGRVWTAVMVPAEGTYKSDAMFVWIGGVMIFVASILLAIWILQNMKRTIEINKVISKAAAEASIVSNLFPAEVRERMIKDAETKKGVFVNDGREQKVLSEDRLNRFLTSEGIFGSRPIAQLHPYTTIMFSDLCGFTAWSSTREPASVFTLLECIFHSFDSIAARRKVFKVETIGDAYVAVCGLPEPCKEHAIVMSRFATECSYRFQKLVKALEKTLGPDTGDLGCRFGLHSGQVVAGVLRGERGRFQLFGDTVNMAARMESTCLRNKIQVSAETAELLTAAGRGKWLIPRQDPVVAKGKGKVHTYFLQINAGSKASSTESDSTGINNNLGKESTKSNRMVAWNVEVLSGLLKGIVAERSVDYKSPFQWFPPSGENPLNEVAEVIPFSKLPQVTPCKATKRLSSSSKTHSVKLEKEVVQQLHKLVESIADMYRDNPFHNFEHCSHVVISVTKMMQRIVEIEKKESTFGIASDPLTLFACAFSALIHDLDHQGIPNMVLVEQESPLALKYNNKSVAEQNSVDLAWDLLLRPEYQKLRECICCNEEEFIRFRQLVINSVMATDIMDMELGAARKGRWNKAFCEGDDSTTQDESEEVQRNRKATIVVEHLIQASDVAHTMQHWHIYAKWNQRLFDELYRAYENGYLKKDPSQGWYEGEMGFFDYYVIPLAKKLFTCGVFGVSSDELLNYALINRKEWEEKGEEMVRAYLKKHEKPPESVPVAPGVDV